MSMKVHVLTNWQNEEWLAPLFLRHYNFADRITIVLEPSTNDHTREEIDKWMQDKTRIPEIEVIEHAECDGLIDDTKKAEHDDSIIHASDADWLFRVDSDEFVFPHPYGRDTRRTLEDVPDERLAIICAQWQVFRHVSDVDVDRSRAPVPQRIHGHPDRTDQYSSGFLKPCIMRPRYKPNVSIGCHFIVGFNGDQKAIHGGPVVLGRMNDATGTWLPWKPDDPRIHNEVWSGAHWCRAEPSVCIPRRVDQRHLRLGGWNKELDERFRGGKAPDREQMVREMEAELKAHENDPVVIT